MVMEKHGKLKKVLHVVTPDYVQTQNKLLNAFLQVRRSEKSSYLSGCERPIVCLLCSTQWTTYKKLKFSAYQKKKKKPQIQHKYHLHKDLMDRCWNHPEEAYGFKNQTEQRTEKGDGIWFCDRIGIDLWLVWQYKNKYLSCIFASQPISLWVQLFSEVLHL